MRFYFDTCIWMDLFLDRNINGKFAKELLEKIILYNYEVVYSDFTIFELKEREFSDQEIRELLTIFKSTKIIKLYKTKFQFIEAKQLSKNRNISIGDSLHAILARDSESTLITRDNDFNKIKDVIKAKKPEDLV